MVTPRKKATTTDKVRAILGADERAGRNGMGTLKSILLSALLAGGAGGGGFFAMRGAAPDPEVVKKTADDVNQIKTELAKLNVTLAALAAAAGNDKNEIERRFQEQQRSIDRLNDLAEKARKIDEIERRVTKLEGK